MNTGYLQNQLANPNRFKIEIFDNITSTNDYVNDQGKNGAPEWSVVIAEHQTAGKGRYKRHWESPPGSGLWFSILLRPKISAQYLNLINLFTAYTLAQFLEKAILETCQQYVDISLKWPNDLLIDNRKISGILLEASFSADMLQYVVVGIGINVNQMQGDFPPELQAKAGSLKIATNHHWQRSSLLTGYLDFFYENYHYYFPHSFQSIVELYQRKIAMLGEVITVNNENEKIQGVFSGLTPEGHLILGQNGHEKIITTGDVFGN